MLMEMDEGSSPENLRNMKMDVIFHEAVEMVKQREKVLIGTICQLDKLLLIRWMGSSRKVTWKRLRIPVQQASMSLRKSCLTWISNR